MASMGLAEAGIFHFLILAPNTVRKERVQKLVHR